MTKRGNNYDLIVHRAGKPSFGYMFDWGDENASPASIESAPPDIPVGTSSGVTQAGGPFTARDAAPPYPIELNNWQDGAGQTSYDREDSSPEAYRSSRNIDVTQEGHFELGPRIIHFPDWYITNKVFAALGTFWAGFSKSQLRFMHRYMVTSSSSSYLGNTASSSFVIVPANNIPDLAIPQALSAPLAYNASYGRMGDYLYCPNHNEIVRVTGVSGGTLTVQRGACGTSRAAHTPGEQWYGFNWTPVTYSGTAPSRRLTAMETDGRYVYAAFHDVGSDNGEIRYGKADSVAWQPFTTAANIVALCFCGGYLYGAQDMYGAGDVSAAGWFNTADSNNYTKISLDGAVSQGVKTVALVGAGNFVYWVVSDGVSRSWIYRIQHSSTDTFELVAEMPHGFVATCAHTHLGYLYVGGYIDMLATTAGDTNLPRYEGALYLVGADNASERVVKLRNFYDEAAYDSRVKGLASSGPYVYILSNEDVYVYDTIHGGWSHYADTLTSTITTYSGDGGTPGEWIEPGFTWDNFGDDVKRPHESQAFVTDYAAWDANNDGYVDDGKVVMDQSSGADFRVYRGEDYDGSRVLVYRVYRAAPGKYVRWTIDGLPSDAATVEVQCGHLQSQAACINICGSNKEVRVYLNGLVSGGEVVKHRVGLGVMTDPNGDVQDYDYRWAEGFSVGWHTYRITYSGIGARVYVDGVLALQASYSELRNVSGEKATQFRFSVGWPGDGQDDSIDERVAFGSMVFTADGAYQPGQPGSSTVVVTGMSDIDTMQGVSVVPVPGNGASVGGFDYINAQEIVQSGYLETSDSAFHMGVKKYFTAVTVEHSRICPGQQLTVTPYIDGSGVGGSQAVVGSSSTVSELGVNGEKIRVRVTMSDNDPNRPFDERLRVFRITSRFFTVNSQPLHTYYLNCREGVQCRNGHDWGEDPEEAIRNLFEAADSGEVAEVESLFTANLPNGREKVRIQKVVLYQGAADLKRYDHLSGTCMVEMRKLERM